MHETINGCPILATYFTPGCEGYVEGRIILVDRGERQEERYVVAWQPKAEARGACVWYKGWEEARYCRSLKDARGEFVKRLKKEPV